MDVFEYFNVLCEDREGALEAVAGALQHGQLTLFVGAGISRSGYDHFPDWSELVRRCCEKAGESFDPGQVGNSDYLREKMDGVEECCQRSGKNYPDEVLEALYRGVPVYDVDTMRGRLLMSLGSLVMKSTRGGARAIVTYNYDDLLEWYLEYHGFTVDSVPCLPSLRRNADVVVYHPHGFLPRLPKYAEQRSERIVFGQRSYEIAIRPDTPWNRLQMSLFGESVVLIIGMSGDDPHIRVLNADTYDALKKARAVGFAILKEGEANGDKISNLKRRGIVPIFIREYAELPELLFGICQRASGL